MPQFGKKYAQVLDLLESLRVKADANGIELPQICVTGDQSSGKSSLLSSIVQLDGLLPEGGGMVTKCPIVLHLEPSKDNTTRIEVTDAIVDVDAEEPGVSVYDDINDACEAIKSAQSAILEYENKIVSATPVQVKVIAPNLPRLVLVDLPGIIHNGENVEAVVKINRRYIKNERSLIVVVIVANADINTQKAVALAEEADSDGSRTLQVFTKCDSFSSTANKNQVQAEICDAIESQNHLGPHAVCCRLNGERVPSSEEEREKIMENLSAVRNLVNRTTRIGVESLCERLELFLAELIKRNIPSLEKSLSDKLREAERVLESLGETEKSRDTILAELRYVLKDEEKKRKSVVTSLLEQFYRDLLEVKKRITEDLVKDNFHWNVFEFPFFQGSTALGHCINVFLAEWTSISKSFVEFLITSMKEEEQKHMDSLTVGPLPKRLIEGYLYQSHRKLDEVRTELSTRVADAYNLEHKYRSMNHYVTSKFEQEKVIPENLISEISSCMASDDFEEELDSLDSEVGKQRLFERTIREFIDNHIESFERKNLKAQVEERVLNAAHAYFSVALKRYADNIVGIVEDVVLIPWYAEWVDHVNKNSNLKECAEEDINVVKARKQATKTKQDMKSCLEQLGRVQSKLEVRDENDADENDADENDADENDADENDAGKEFLHIYLQNPDSA